MRALFLLGVIGALHTFHPNMAAAEERKICEDFVWDTGDVAYKAFCRPSPDSKSWVGRAEAFDDGHIHITVKNVGCPEQWEHLRCEVSGNLWDWPSFNSGQDVDDWYANRVPLIAIACFCGPWQPPTQPEEG